MIAYSIILTIAFVAVTAIARAQFCRNAEQIRMIGLLEQRVKQEEAATAIERQRTSTLQEAIRLQVASISLLTQQVGELEVENATLWRCVRSHDLRVVLAPRVPGCKQRRKGLN